MEGKKYNKLTIVRIFKHETRNKKMCEFKCECGGDGITELNAVRTGHTKTCGRCKLNNMIGNIYDGIKIVSIGKKIGYTSYVIGICKCGRTHEFIASDIRAGKTKSCGKCSKVGLIGNKFGFLTVLEETEPYKDGQSMYRCLCDCGNEVVTYMNHIKRGHTLSCGCKTSKSNLIFAKLLEEYKIKFESEKTFDNLKNKCNLKFDFYIDDLSLAIELDGEQHFRPVNFGGSNNDILAKFGVRVINDAIKNQYCEDNDIILIRIPYYNFDNLPQILNYILINNNSCERLNERGFSNIGNYAKVWTANII